MLYQYAHSPNIWLPSNYVNDIYIRLQFYIFNIRSTSEHTLPSCSRTYSRFFSCLAHFSLADLSFCHHRPAPCSHSRSFSPSQTGCSTAWTLVGLPSTPESPKCSMLQRCSEDSGTQLNNQILTLLLCSSLVLDILDNPIFQRESYDGCSQLRYEQCEQEEVVALKSA